MSRTVPIPTGRMPAVPHTETAFFPYSFSCLLCFDDGHLPGRQGIEPPVLPLAGGTVKFHMHSLAGFNRIPVDVGVHQLQAQALRSAFLRLEDNSRLFHSLPEVLPTPSFMGSTAITFPCISIFNRFYLAECHNRHLHLFFEIVFY